MPRIDPLQLLKCLGVLLTPNGGIRSKDEVQRLASLMMKFSKKLVSKCVYILILKNTETDLLGMFMSAGGWTLVLTWLSDGIYGKNWALVTELLELLLMCPVDVERLKSNSIPRLVKGLSKDENLGQVNVLATKLVEQWLKIVKDETVTPEREVSSTVVIVKKQQGQNQNDYVVQVPDAEDDEAAAPEAAEEVTVNVDAGQLANEVVISPHQFYKITVRDGKQVIAKVDSVVNNSSSANNSVVNNKMDASDEMQLAEEIVGSTNHLATAVSDNSEEPTKEKENKTNKDSNERRSSSSKERRASSKERSRHRSSKSSSSSSSSSRDKNSSSSSSRDKNRDKDKNRDRTKDKYKHKSNGKHSSSSSGNSNNSSKDTHHNSSSNNKEKQAEKDKDTLAKIQPKSVDKLGRIPKKSSSSEDTKTKEKTKSSISIEVRKKDGNERPKTVKVFNSKLRSTGLEEAARPPPPRPAVKKVSAVLPTLLPAKRPSPSREPLPPPEKRIKLPEIAAAAAEPIQEKPGGIKLIPAKPKPAFLQESDMFMDALAASATNKKEPKKRKRRTSVSKDSNSNAGNTSPPLSPSVSITGTSPLNSPLALKSITAPKFYKDTLDDEQKPTETEADKAEVADADSISANAQQQEEEGPSENVVKEVDGIRGVLVYHKRRGGPKKSVKWRVEGELEEVQYFELDETERVNVTKTFMDMKQMEHTGEREALQMSRKLPNEDLMDERTVWRALVPIDLKPSLADHGKKSLEKDIQFAREKVVLQALYFSRSMLPDSGAEPDPEIHQMTDPITIPLDDVTGNPDSVNDFQNTPWPEPKGSPPHIPHVPSGQVAGGPPMFPGAIPPFAPQLGPPGFPGIAQPFGGGVGPNFMPPPNMMGGGDWRNMAEVGPGMPHPSDVNHGVSGPGPMNAGVFVNNRGGGPGGLGSGPGPDGYTNNMMDENNVGFTPQGFGPGPMPGGPPGPPGPMYPNFPTNQRGNPNRGGFRNMGRGGWFRPAGPPPGWHGGNRGGGGGGAGHWGVGGGGGGGRGGGICKQFKMHGYCRQRETCPYMHPQGNAPY